MGKKRKSGDKQLAVLALITAILSLITHLIALTSKIVEWLAEP